MNRIMSAVYAGVLGATLGLGAIVPSFAMPVAQTAVNAGSAVQTVQYEGEYRPRYNRDRRIDRGDRYDRRDRRDRRDRFESRRERAGSWNGYRGYREHRRGYRRHSDGYWYPLGAFGGRIILGN
ncbi:hypothetical protein HB779_10220 [Phyllobacterium sp. 628]|uniref:hypothetical protein n=1 Tax=Phyllobacterium sp. 628 TaxID=2718938 RepID=UPI0016626A77|nr:hypothetical protein [Phyllobacterium sp. 628]QND52243.1 hypothetical protein HB779_10220 [Phyllobacterium sp. 628]